MLRGQEDLIARDGRDRVRIPRTLRSTAEMVGDRIRYIDSRKAANRTPDSEIDVLKIGPEPLVQQPHVLKQLLSEQRRGHGSEADRARLVPQRRIRPVRSAAIGAS